MEAEIPQDNRTWPLTEPPHQRWDVGYLQTFRADRVKEQPGSASELFTDALEASSMPQNPKRKRALTDYTSPKKRQVSRIRLKADQLLNQAIVSETIAGDDTICRNFFGYIFALVRS